MDNVQNMLCLL